MDVYVGNADGGGVGECVGLAYGCGFAVEEDFCGGVLPYCLGGDFCCDGAGADVCLACVAFCLCDLLDEFGADGVAGQHVFQLDDLVVDAGYLVE